jgi:hypothetical protein
MPTVLPPETKAAAYRRFAEFYRLRLWLLGGEISIDVFDHRQFVCLVVPNEN